MVVRRVKAVTEEYSLGFPRLYREELRAVAAAIAEAGELAILVDGTFRGSSPDDFDDPLMPDAPGRVMMAIDPQSAAPPIMVVFAKDGGAIGLANPTLLTTGAATRIQQICRRCHRPMLALILRATRTRVRFFALLAALAVVAVVLSNIEGTGFRSDIPAIIYGLVGFALVGLSLKSGVKIINVPRAERPTYWQRNGNAWIIGIVTSLLGVALGYALGKLK